MTRMEDRGWRIGDGGGWRVEDGGQGMEGDGGWRVEDPIFKPLKQ